MGNCSSDPNNPEKLANVNPPDSDTVSRGQTSDATSPTSPSEESKDRHDKIFSEVRPSDQQGTGDSQAAPTSLASNDSSQIAIPAENLSSTDASKPDSVEYVESTNNSAKESNIPNVLSAPVAPVQSPSESSDVQKTNDATPAPAAPSVAPASQFQSMGPSSVQPNQGETVSHLNSTSSEPVVSSPDSEVKAESTKTTTEPPVEMSSGATPTTFAPEESKANDAGQQSGTISEVSERVDAATANSSKEPEKTQTQEVAAPVEGSKESEKTQTKEAPAPVEGSKEPEKTQTQEVPTPVDPKQDKNVPVTFKPTAFSRVVEVQTTGASEVLDSHGVPVHRNVKRAASGVGLITSDAPIGKSINASKDAAHTTRIQRR